MEQPKPHFLEICVPSHFNSSMIQAISDLSGVARSIVDTMFMGTAVERADAEKVLSTVSQYVGRTLSLDNVNVPVLDPIETQTNTSEVTNLIAQLQAEYEAAQRGISGLAYGTTKHKFITQKMENMGKIQEDLESIVGKEASIALIIDQLNACSDEKEMSSQ